jgi:predicted AlkP superfamily phosphohydrolase/phosphomutase
MSDAPAGLVVLGIDAASPELLDAWIADGTLPVLGALAARGVRGRTRGVEGFFVGSTWPTLYTATNPAKHGVHYLLEMVPGSYALQPGEHGAFVRREAFWHALARAGRRVAVLDVPLTRLDPPAGGVQVVEWGGHDSIFGFGASTPALARRILELGGEHPVQGSCDAEGRTAAGYASFVERLEDGACRKGQWTRALLADGGWDLFLQVFTEAHCAGHQCWHLHGPAHPAHDPAVATEVGDPLRRVYRAIDRAIGEVLEVAGDAHVIVFAAHGMSHWYGAQFLLSEILVRLGAMVRPDAPAPDATAPWRSAARAAWRRLPERMRTPIRAALRPRAASPPPALDADVVRSRCFVQPNGLAVGGIRLNLAGREPAGILAPGEEAEAFVGWLSRELLAIVDERTGAPLVRRVLRTSRIHEGEHLALLPDLLVEWSDDVPTGAAGLAGGAGARVRASSAAIGMVEGVNEFARTGEHRPGGWLLAAGPGITPGALATEPALADLAPTFSAMLGVRLAGVDGSPIEELVPAVSARGMP